MIKKENLILTQVPDIRDWVIKRWELRCEGILLGHIIKRHAGRGTPLVDGKKKHIIYQTHANLLSGVGLLMPKAAAHKEDLKSAKKFIISKWAALLNNLTR